jgi:hypothetical protein
LGFGAGGREEEMSLKGFFLTATLAVFAGSVVIPDGALAARKPAASKSHAKSSNKSKSKASARKTPVKGRAAKGRSGKGRAAKSVRVAERPDPVKPVLYVSDGPTRYASCSNSASLFAEAAAKNASTLDTLQWAPFGVGENGWQIYESLIGKEIGTDCGGGTPVFAEKLAAWQARYNLPSDGVFGTESFAVFKGLWQERRPFVMMRVAGLCPDAPPGEALTAVPPEAETFDRDNRALRSDAYQAYEAMLEAARRESPALRNDLKALTMFSGYRSPESDAARCAEEKNCDGSRRAACSAHRTGTAIDLNVGWIGKDDADSTALENRKWQVRSPAYKWLVKNAHRFGFVNYAFEPWHWEYVGGHPLQQQQASSAPASEQTGAGAPATAQ